MKKLWSLAGRLAFWISWPALFVYLYTSRRTRILVVCKDEVLVTKGWLGVGQWSLPGGGMHRGEDPVTGAIRELEEETGMKIKAAQLKLIHEKRSGKEYGLSYQYSAYALELPLKPQTVAQKYELLGLKWINWRDALIEKSVSPNVKDVVSDWSRSRLS